MFIIIYVSSKNLNSLTNFLKFFYKLKKDQALKLEFPSLQSQRKKKFSFFSTLQSPHVNKTSQEQFECQVYSKKLKIRVSQTTKFLAVWKTVKTALFPDVQIKTQFRLKNIKVGITLLPKVNLDTFRLVTLVKLKVKRLGCTTWSSTTINTSLNLLDIRGEILLKSLW